MLPCHDLVLDVEASGIMRWTASAAMSAGPTTRRIGSVVRSCSVRHHKPSPRSPPPVPVIFGLAPSAVARCGSSKGLRLRRSSSVLHPTRTPSPHETTIDITKLLRVAARSLPLCLLASQTSAYSFASSSFHRTFGYSATLPLFLCAVVPCRTSSAHRHTCSRSSASRW